MVLFLVHQFTRELQGRADVLSSMLRSYSRCTSSTVRLCIVTWLKFRVGGVFADHTGLRVTIPACHPSNAFIWN